MTQDVKNKPGRPKVYKAKVGGAIHDGEGGFFAAGDALPSGCDIESLKAKGLAE